MSLFSKNTNERVLKPGGFLSPIKVTIDDKFVRYRGMYGDSAIIPIKNLVTVSTSPHGFGKSDVVFTGQGNELARIDKLPASWAEKIMVWVIEELAL